MHDVLRAPPAAQGAVMGCVCARAGGGGHVCQGICGVHLAARVKSVIVD